MAWGGTGDGNGKHPIERPVDVPLRPIAWVAKPPTPRARRRMAAAHRARWARRALWALSAVVVVSLSVAAVALRPRPPGAVRPLDDVGLVRSADAVCARAQRRLEALPHPQGPGDADAVDRYAAEIDVMVAELEALPATGDQAAVDDWVGTWAAYARTGRDYAEAVRAGDEARARAANAAARRLSLRANAIAAASGMADCVFARR